MPISLAIYPLERLVVGVATGVLTLPDLATFAQDIVRARVRHYRKLIDETRCQMAFGEKELAAFAQVMRTMRTERRRGPLAIIADRERAELAHFFAALDIDRRPAKVFRDIFKARTWLSKYPVDE